MNLPLKTLKKPLKGLYNALFYNGHLEENPMLRFAILCRVSTEIQEKEGASLEVQQKTLIKCVNQLNGKIIKEYIGSESATSGDKKRPILEQLLMDARNKVFDCLMVYDLSRITRDPIKSKIIFSALKKYDIKLYIQSQQYLLNNPEISLMIGIMSEINAFQVSMQNQKSIESKIELAKKGWHMVGSHPFGRKLTHHDHSRPPEWTLDEEKVKIAHEVYDLYINKNTYADKIARILNKSRSFIYSILKDKPRLLQTFKLDDGSKLEIVTPIPPIFTKEQQDLIKDKLSRNRKDNSKKYQYLLSGLVKCEHCKLSYIGMTHNLGKHSYYRHSVHTITPLCKKHIQKDLLDNLVLEHISELVSNNEILMRTIKSCNKNSNVKKGELENEIAILIERQKKLEKRKAKALKLVLDDIISEEDISKEMKEIKDNLNEIITNLISKRIELESISNTEVPEKVFERVKNFINTLRSRWGYSFSKWSFQMKRLLVEWFFGISKDHGIWIASNDEETIYTIKSNLGTIAFGWLDDEDGPSGVGGLGNLNAQATATLDKFSNIFNDLGIYIRNSPDQDRTELTNRARH